MIKSKIREMAITDTTAAPILSLNVMKSSKSGDLLVLHVKVHSLEKV
ncbi:MAG: hypothetical protein WCD19_10035 [Nitrososphaeraceae archaeon]